MSFTKSFADKTKLISKETSDITPDTPSRDNTFSKESRFSIF